jgi:hypothetical protein
LQPSTCNLQPAKTHFLPMSQWRAPSSPTKLPVNRGFQNPLPFSTFLYFLSTLVYPCLPLSPDSALPDLPFWSLSEPPAFPAMRPPFGVHDLSPLFRTFPAGP